MSAKNCVRLNSRASCEKQFSVKRKKVAAFSTVAPHGSERGFPWVAIGSPAALGSNLADSTSATSISLTTTQSAPAGSAIIVIASEASLGTTPTSASCSDSAGNTYSTDVTEYYAGYAILTICSAHAISAPLAAGAMITATSVGAAGPQVLRIQAWSVTGLAALPLDQTASAAAVSASPSSGAAATTAQSTELLFGAIVDSNQTVAGSGFTPGTNGTSNVCTTTGTPSYTNLGGIGSASGDSLFGMYCVVSSTGAYAASATISAPYLWEAALATYK